MDKNVKTCSGASALGGRKVGVRRRKGRGDSVCKDSLLGRKEGLKGLAVNSDGNATGSNLKSVARSKV